MYDLVITDGTIVTAERTQRADLAITNGCIAAISTGGELGQAKRELSAEGLHVLPGLVDAHVHLREPGASYKETFRTGTMAAAAGGVTAVAAIPNTDPLLDREKPFTDAIALGRETAVVDFAIFAGVRFAAPGDIDELANAGAIGFDVCDDPFAVASSAWTEVFAKLREQGLPLGFYLLDFALQAEARAHIQASGGSQIEQYLSFMNPELELAAAARAVAYGAQYKVPIILRTVTTHATLEFVRVLRRGDRSAAIKVEMAPHYLFLTSDDLKSQMTAAQMLPPLRGIDELPALWKGIVDGTVDYLGSDHAPHAPHEKGGDDLFASPPGIVGLETTLPLMLTAVHGSRLTLNDVARLCCRGPAQTLGIYPRKGTIAVGSDADLVLVDAAQSWTFDASKSYSKGNPSPFHGWEFVGRPHSTFLRGQQVMSDGEVSDVLRGEFLRPGDGS